MIDLNEIVYALNEHLSSKDFALYLGTNAAPTDDGRIVGSVIIGRVPYGFSTAEIDAESLNITITFDLPCGTEIDDYTRDKALFEIGAKLLAWKKIAVITADEETYYLNTFFEMLPPGSPYVDCGRITQQYVVSGTALLQNANCGAVVGNNEVVYINGIKVLKVDKASSTVLTGDNNLPLSEGLYLPEMENIAKANNFKITCLFMGTEIDEELYGIGEGLDVDINKEYIIEVKHIMADGSVKLKGARRVCKLVSVNTYSAPGVFLKYDATFQMIKAEA